MFDKIIAEINAELDKLRPKMAECYRLMEKVEDKAIKNRLQTQYQKLSGEIDRLALCISILRYECTLELSDDFKVIKLI